MRRHCLLPAVQSSCVLPFRHTAILHDRAGLDMTRPPVLLVSPATAPMPQHFSAFCLVHLSVGCAAIALLADSVAILMFYRCSFPSTAMVVSDIYRHCRAYSVSFVCSSSLDNIWFSRHRLALRMHGEGGGGGRRPCVPLHRQNHHWRTMRPLYLAVHHLPYRLPVTCHAPLQTSAPHRRRFILPNRAAAGSRRIPHHIMNTVHSHPTAVYSRALCPQPSRDA